jgi:hypothetical protein
LGLSIKGKEENAMKTLTPTEVLDNANREELGSLRLSDREADDIVAFLRALTDGYWQPPHWRRLIGAALAGRRKMGAAHSARGCRMVYHGGRASCPPLTTITWPAFWPNPTRSPMRTITSILFLSLLALAEAAQATVFYSKEEAFELAFGKGAEVEPLAVFLTDGQAAEVEKAAQVKLDSKLYTLQVGRRGGQVLGYAAIESHNVRTQPETVMILLSPAGELVRVEMLAFHEPPEYQPPARWFERLYRRPLGELRLNQGVDGIAGATLSSRASLDGIRKVLAIYQVAVKEGKD